MNLERAIGEGKEPSKYMGLAARIMWCLKGHGRAIEVVDPCTLLVVADDAERLEEDVKIACEMLRCKCDQFTFHESGAVKIVVCSSQ